VPPLSLRLSDPLILFTPSLSATHGTHIGAVTLTAVVADAAVAVVDVAEVEIHEPRVASIVRVGSRRPVVVRLRNCFRIAFGTLLLTLHNI
jgi:hypothetical protein